ncbi:MAG TPA: dodecin [Chloroflexia bacterium]|nr:dodecin [Chloroflexia bacterium]
MSEHIYKKIDLVGSSPTSIEDAVQTALTKAAKSVRNMRWFEVSEIRGLIDNDKVSHWQVEIQVGFTVED